MTSITEMQFLCVYHIWAIDKQRVFLSHEKYPGYNDPLTFFRGEKEIKLKALMLFVRVIVPPNTNLTLLSTFYLISFLFLYNKNTSCKSPNFIIEMFTITLLSFKTQVGVLAENVWSNTFNICLYQFERLRDWKGNWNNTEENKHRSSIKYHPRVTLESNKY